MTNLAYIGRIIADAREDARQKLSADVVGDQVVSDNALVRYANFAIERITSVVAMDEVNPSTFFERTKIISLVANQAFYSVDDNVYLGERYKDIRITPSNDEFWWRELREREISYSVEYTGFPQWYTRSQGKILLAPIPQESQGRLKVVYDRAHDKVSTRKGLVSSTTGTPLTSVTLNNATFTTDVDSFDGHEYFCVVDRFGTVTAYNIPFTQITATTITVPGHTLATGESIPANAYVVPGRWTGTHINLPLICEKYITQYVTVKAFRKESSTDQASANSELGAMEEEIKMAFRSVSKDQIQIQIERRDILLEDF